MAFKKSSRKSAPPRDPGQLYRSLAKENNGPSAVWHHQGEILGTWHSDFANGSDVAIELPTGAGKTLVGAIIGEFRRRHGDRVAYLCPTRQLAKQTVEKLTEYGVPAVLLTGKVADWNAIDRARYTACEAVAVSVYSHVFNSNPALDDADLLLLDDAHAAAGAVAGPWTITVARGTEDSAYFDLVDIAHPALAPETVSRLRSTNEHDRFRQDVYLADPATMAPLADSIEQCLKNAADSNRLTTEAKYALKLTQGHLDSCLFYFSYGKLQLRPFISPTFSHGAFHNAQRRIYMSATLGSGGELERVFGRQHIKRIPVPDGWEDQGTGRRMFVFPTLATDLAADSDQLHKWLKETIGELGRAVVLTPDIQTAKHAFATYKPDHANSYDATDVEDDLRIFTSDEAGFLALANRYDGIDLPDEDCRIVVLHGFPSKGDLQELFLHYSLGAVDVLQERIRARIQQGSGRATRNTKDFSVVIVLGDDLVRYFTSPDIQQLMQPELQAELTFGYNNSVQISSSEISENIGIFLEHAEDWHELEEDISDDRQGLTRRVPPGTKELEASVRFEVMAGEALWQKDWDLALEHLRSALLAIQGGSGSRRYAALLNYFAYYASSLVDSANSGESNSTQSYFKSARQIGRASKWESHLPRPAQFELLPAVEEMTLVDQEAVSGIRSSAQLIARSSKFTPLVSEAREGLSGTDSTPYETGLVLLGKLLGASPSEGDGGATAAPDATWVFGRQTWVAVEAKSEALADTATSVKYVKQANGHLAYIRERRRERIPEGSIVLFATSQKTCDLTAGKLADSFLYRVTPDQILRLFGRTVEAWETMRAQGGAEKLTDGEIHQVFFRKKVLPSQWMAYLTQDPMYVGEFAELEQLATQ